MFPPMAADEADYYPKPMNCPFHILIFKSKTRSYRELPLRYSELGTVYRHERSGTLHGLLRSRGLTQDDSHIFCRPDQIVDEMVAVIDFLRDLYATVGLGPDKVLFSTRPEKSVGSDDDWQRAEAAIPEALGKAGLDYAIDEGAGNFYGPKIDIDVRDAIGRSWQLGTIQLDFQLPDRFDLVYTDAEGERVRPVMIHRALFGSIERFVGVLVEHFAGAFPLWLAPVQAIVLPISDRHREYAASVRDTLAAAGLRVELDDRQEKIGYKIREAQLQKIPYMLVTGDREAAEATVSVRSRSGGDLGARAIDAFIASAKEEIAARALAPAAMPEQKTA
jgi:threonyl-tRNA synthetase